ncbi:MAG: acyltransferase [Pseudomonadota bacterium]|nr:acyltransferase [Pseudomonadota bacterium]
MSSSTERRWTEFDGLRGFLSMIVVVGHISASLGVWAFASMQPWYWMPMDMFFVFSGFLLGRIAITNIGQPGFLKSYFVRRILRIWPVYYVVVLTVSAVALALVATGHQPESLWSTSGFIKQMLFLQFTEYYLLDERGAYLQALFHTWSVSVEEHFYILLPLFAFLLHKRSVRVIVGVLLVACAVAVVLRAGLDMHYWVLGTRLHSFALGLLLAYMVLWAERGHWSPLQSRRLVALFGLVALVAVFLSPLMPGPARVRWMAQSLTAAVYGAFLVAAIYQTNLAGGRGIPLLQNRVLTHLGEISYSTYLWHWPLMIAIRPWVVDAHLPEPVVVVMTLALVIAAANLSYYTIEQPFQKLKHLWAYRPTKQPDVPPPSPPARAGMVVARGE